MLHHLDRASRLRAWWQGTPVAVRWVAYIAIPMGCVTVGLGVYGDSHHWWDGRSFLTNLVSSFASLLFGVPTALVVLAHLSGMQAEAMERRAVQRSARQAAVQFERALLAGIKPQDLVAARSAVERAAIASHAYRDRLGDRRGSHGSLEAYRARQAAFGEHLNLSGLDSHIWLAEISLRWNRLDTELRPRLEEMGLQWLTMPSYLVFRNSMQELESLPAQVFEARLEGDLERMERRPHARRPGDVYELLPEAKNTSVCLSAISAMLRQMNYVRQIAS
ncbi:hypothetical protein [Streptomyces chartreusis]|uniref:hypothetical protein n=1 Tax=Streptomyces chartreusis TaxID=1969 RepID=UPI00369DB486